MEGEYSCFRGVHFNGGRMVMLQKWSLYWREYGHVMDVVSFMEGEWSFHRGAHFNGHMYILLYSMVNRRCFVSCIQYILPFNLLIFHFLFIDVFLHTAKCLHTGEQEDFMPAKIEQVCQSREAE